MNAAQQFYAALGAPFMSLRGRGLDLRNPHTRKAGPGRKGKHKQGPSLLSRLTPRTRQYWQLRSVLDYRRNGFIAGE